MGTNSRFTGEVRIEPPLNWKTIKKVNELKHIMDGWEIKLVIDEDEQDTENGVMTIMTCSSIVPWTDQPYRGYNVGKALQEVMDLCTDHIFDGYFEWCLEDGSSMGRIVAHGTVVEEVAPTITWDMP